MNVDGAFSQVTPRVGIGRFCDPGHLNFARLEQLQRFIFRKREKMLVRMQFTGADSANSDKC